MNIIDVPMPEIIAVYPECDHENIVDNNELETGIPKYFAIASVECDECDHLFTIGLAS